MMLSKSLTAMLLLVAANAAAGSVADHGVAPEQEIFTGPDVRNTDIFDGHDNKGGLRKLTGRGRGRGRSSTVDVDLDVTNLTFQQPFGPFFVAVHNQKAGPLFTLGMPSSDGLRDLAENGSPDMLISAFTDDPNVQYVGRAGGLPAGGKMTITVPVSRPFQYVTIGSMCLNTNDCFVALNSQRVYIGAFSSPGYDSGTERNNESCMSIPGPACPADSGNAEVGQPSVGGEGFVHIHRGFFGISDDPEDIRLSEAGYDWRNPMMRVEIDRAMR